MAFGWHGAAYAVAVPSDQGDFSHHQFKNEIENRLVAVPITKRGTRKGEIWVEFLSFERVFTLNQLIYE
jgi:hypothetical protein